MKSSLKSKITKASSDALLLRALGKDAFFKTIGLCQHPTILVGSAQRYRFMESFGDIRGDRFENIILNKVNGIQTYNELCNPTYSTCYTIHKSQQYMFKIFNDTSAIVETTVGDLNTLISSSIIPYIKNYHLKKDLADVIKIICKSDHGYVIYYDPEKESSNEENFESINTFSKRIKYAVESEYRGSIVLNSQHYLLPEKFIIPIHSITYINRIYLLVNHFSSFEIKSIQAYCDSHNIKLSIISTLD